MRRTIFAILLVFGVAAAGCESAPVDAPDQLGPFAVGFSAFVAVDPARDDREVPVDIWYPVDAADVQGVPLVTYPLLGTAIGLDSDVAFDSPPVSARPGQILVIFSHGFGGISKASIGLMEALASHGFIVASPEHTGNSQFSPGDDFDLAASNRVAGCVAGDRHDDPSQPGLCRPVLRSARRGAFRRHRPLVRWDDRDRGWRPDGRAHQVTPASQRSSPFRRSLTLSYRATNARARTRASPPSSFRRSPIPVLLMGGTEDVDVFLENNTIAFDQVTNAPSVYKVDVLGANHTHFANVCVLGDLLIDQGFGPEAWPNLGATGLIEPYEQTCSPEAFPIEEATRLQNLYAVAFFRRYLLGKQGYARFLSEEYADTEPAITLSSK